MQQINDNNTIYNIDSYPVNYVHGVEVDFNHQEVNHHYDSEYNFLCKVQQPLCKKCNALARLWQVGTSRWEYNPSCIRVCIDSVELLGLRDDDKTLIIIVRKWKKSNSVVLDYGIEKIIIIHNSVPFTFDRLHPELIRRINELITISQIRYGEYGNEYPMNMKRQTPYLKVCYHARWWEECECGVEYSSFARPHLRRTDNNDN